MKTVFGFLLYVCLNISAFAGYKTIGFRVSTLPGAQNGRPLELAVWYPSTTTATPQLIAETRYSPVPSPSAMHPRPQVRFHWWYFPTAFAATGGTSHG